jgi:hypothetical protein
LPYKIRVLDLFHYMDEDEEYELEASFPTAEAAIAEAKRRLDAQLTIAPGATPEEVFSNWMSFGEDPVILCTDATLPAAGFSGSAYVRQRATELCLAAEWARWAEHA